MPESVHANVGVSAASTALPFEELSYQIGVEDFIAWALVARSGYFGLRGSTIRNARFVAGLMFLGTGLLLACLDQVNMYAGSDELLAATIFIVVGSIYSWCFFGPVWRWRLGRRSRSFADLPVLTLLRLTDTGLAVSVPHLHEEIAWERFKGLDETENHFFLRLARLVAHIIPKRALNNEQMVKDLRAFLAGKIPDYEKVK